MFGTDDEPIIMEFNLTKELVTNRPVPLDLRLMCY